MTNGPSATIGEILDVDLPRPRERVKLADDPHYNHLRAEVLKFLYERQRKPEEHVKTSEKMKAINSELSSDISGDRNEGKPSSEGRAA